MRNESYLGFDIILFLAVVSLMVIGILFIYSSGITSTGENVSTEYLKQIFSAIAGLCLLFFLTFANYNRIKDWIVYIYLGFILILILTLFIGKTVNASRSWLSIGSLHIGQPSELMKIVTILALAAFLDSNQGSIKNLGTLLLSSLIVAVPMLLILLQPDMGTALVFLPVFYVMTFISGAKIRYLAYSILIFTITVFLGVLPFWDEHFYGGQFWLTNLLLNDRIFYTFYFIVLILCVISLIGYFAYKRKYFYWTSYFLSAMVIALPFAHFLNGYLMDYQIMRFMVFLDPEVDPRGAGWHVIQSITAVGNGGFTGKGFLQGTQSHYRFLPTQSTDFIFSIIAEELGFLGCSFIILLFGIIMYRGYRIMVNSKDFFGMIICSGIVAMLFFHFTVNIGMAIGIMPITGIPLMFLSYGGSALLASLSGIGIMLNIYIRKYRY